MKEISEIADVVEFRTWACREPCTFSSLKEELETARGEDAEAKAEELAQGVMDEIQERQIILNDAYPFECDGYKIQFNAPATAVSTYIFCLGLTLLPPGLISNEQRSVQFETIAMNAAKAYFGGNELRIGAPWATEEIPTYEALLEKVIDLMPNLGPLSRNVAPAGGDCGWDVLIVKRFADKKFPRLVILGNCATGRTDWMNKGMETAPDYFFESFTQTHRSVLITFFAVPFVMDDESRLRKGYPQTVIFDRFRICEHAPIASEEITTWLESTRAAALEVPFS
jgi:hypothetical protein